MSVQNSSQASGGQPVQQQQQGATAPTPQQSAGNATPAAGQAKPQIRDWASI